MSSRGIPGDRPDVTRAPTQAGVSIAGREPCSTAPLFWSTTTTPSHCLRGRASAPDRRWSCVVGAGWRPPRRDAHQTERRTRRARRSGSLAAAQPEPIGILEVSVDGRIAITYADEGGADRLVVLNGADGSTVSTLMMPSHVSALTFDPRGERVVTDSEEAGPLQTWDLTSGNCGHVPVRDDRGAWIRVQSGRHDVGGSAGRSTGGPTLRLRLQAAAARPAATRRPPGRRAMAR